jgi:hypothetical protein
MNGREETSTKGVNAQMKNRFNPPVRYGDWDPEDDEAPRWVHIRKDSYYSAFWFVQGGDQDWWGVLFRPSEESDWQFVSRVRHYHPASKDPFDGLDLKRWKTLIFDAHMPEDEAESTCAGLAEYVAGQWESEVQRTSVHGNGDAFAPAFVKNEFVHRLDIDADDQELSHDE